MNGQKEKNMKDLKVNFETPLLNNNKVNINRNEWLKRNYLCRDVMFLSFTLLFQC